MPIRVKNERFQNYRDSCARGFKTHRFFGQVRSFIQYTLLKTLFPNATLLGTPLNRTVI